MKKLLIFFILILMYGYNEKRRIIVPLYFYNQNEWNKIEKHKNEIVIINPNNGNIYYSNNNYKNLINKLNKNGDLPIGYIYTKWGKRNINEVKTNIDKWISFYKIKGFFIDEVSRLKKNFNYYKELTDYIKSKGNYYIILNVGTLPDKEYFKIADNIIVFENNVDKLTKNICMLNPLKSSIIVYFANEIQMENIITTYKCKGIYVTNYTLPNPYNALPSYFDEEIKLLK